MVFGVQTLVKFCSNHTSPYKTLRSTIWVIHGSCHSLTQKLMTWKASALLREPQNWQLRSPNRKTWTYKPTNLLLHFKHEIQVIHEGLVPNPPWNCEFIPENGCFKNTILSFSNGLFSGVNLLVVSGGCIHFFKGNKKNPQQTPPFRPNLHIHSFFRHGGSTRFNKSLKELGSFGGAMTETTPLKGMTVTGPAGETKKTYTKQLLFDDVLLTN